ncbi:hypothetical protein NKG95_31485 [Mesorhizobium sp. M1423]|uniref:hypothetical protein n=1 Tax=Mesorhizobium sp. M1423 TaxID=2957101 RepID=UPI003337AA7B
MGRTTGMWRDASACLFFLFLIAAALNTGASQAQSAAVPDNFLVDPKPVQIDLGFFERLNPHGKRLVRLEGVNATGGSIELGTPVAGPVLRAGSPDTAIATSEEPGFGQNTCTGAIQSKQMCTLTLQLPGGIGPGAYSIDVALRGAGAGQSLKSVKFEVRSSAWLAGILIALGVVLGAAVTDWRTTGLPATDRRIVAAEMRARAQRLAGSVTKPPVQRQAIELGRVLRTLDPDLIQGNDASARLTEIEGQLEKLASCEQALIAADKAGETSDVFGTLTARLVSALDADDWSATGIDASLSALRAELAQFPQLVAAARRLDAEIARTQGAVAILGADHAAIAVEWRKAQTEREGAFKRLTGASGATAECTQRAAKLDTAAAALADKAGALVGALLDKSDAALKAALAGPAARNAAARQSLDALGEQLLAARNAGGGDQLAKAIGLWQQVAPASRKSAADVELEGVAQAPKSVLPQETELKFIFGPDVFQPAIGASAHELRAVRKSWNMLTNLAVLAGIAATGVLVLWTQNQTWGSVADVVGALLAGAATRMAIGNIALPGKP